MVRKRTTTSKKIRKRRHLTLLPLLAILIVIIVVSGTYLLSNKVIPRATIDRIVSHINIPPKSQETRSNETSQNTTATDNNSSSEELTKAISLTDSSSGDALTENSSNNEPPPLTGAGRTNNPESLPSLRSTEPKEITAGAPSQCAPSAKVISEFYSHLDKQPYFQDFNISSTSEAHFKELIERLLKNPPIVSRETDDLFTILQNTAHFFRIIGRKNITLLKGILDREKPYFENVLEHFYTVTTIPGCSQDQLSLPITQEALYEYAGFFLNTMGGRLYLFRRDSISRMTVNFYAILIVDQANNDQNNKYGLQLKTPINSLISEIEATNNQLKMKETYLDTLYDLKIKYQ